MAFVQFFAGIMKIAPSDGTFELEANYFGAGAFEVKEVEERLGRH